MLENAVLGYNIYWALNNVYNQYPVLKYALSKIISKKLKKLKKDPKKDESNKYEDNENPDIHVILAAYREEDVLPYTVERFVEVAKNYKGKVKLWLTLEEHDEETRKVAKELKRKYEDYVNIVVVPEEYSYGVGKPRALNYSFKQIEKEIINSKREDNSIIGVLDAEDIISPNLFDEVVRKLKHEGYDAVQGILNMKNEDGWKNLQFRGEYGMWYRILLPSKAEANYPVPFGGTTCFFRYKALKEMEEMEEDSHGPWDACNLTEDFDLGMRMYKKSFRLGYAKTRTVKDWNMKYGNRNKSKVAMIDSITHEESPITWEGWLRQRTRWQQGKIQTLKKMLKEFMKNPKNVIKNFFKVYAILMECSTPHLGAINLTGISLSVCAYISNIDFGPAKFLMLYNLGSTVYYSVLQGVGYYLVAKEEKILKKELFKNTLIVALTTPLYWIPQWIADLRAMKREYIDRLSDWEKTQHHGVHIKAKTVKTK